MATTGGSNGESEASRAGKRRRIGPTAGASAMDAVDNYSTVLKSVKLWSEPVPPPARQTQGSSERTTKGPADDHAAERRWRSPAEVARLRFFDAAPRVDAADVERHVLTYLLWTAGGGFWVSWNPTLRARLEEEFSCWPLSERDWECIRSAAAAKKVDLSRKSIGPDELKRVADWLGNGTAGSAGAWHNKVLAAAVMIHMDGCPHGATGAVMVPNATSSEFRLFDAIPDDMLGNVFAFLGASPLRRFSAASSRCRKLVRGNPESCGKWRRNLFFANAGHLEGVDNWDWAVLCAEDCPRAESSPDVSDRAFFSSEAKVVDGGMCYQASWSTEEVAKLSSKRFRNVMYTLEEYFGTSFGRGWAPRLSSYAPGAYLNSAGQPLSFLCKNPYGKAKAPMAVMGYVRDDWTFMFAFAGHDSYGGFIGAGIGSANGWRHKNVELLHQLKVCGRYLPPDDDRLHWPLRRILDTIRRCPAVETEHPWKCPLFDLDYAPAAALLPPSPAGAIATSHTRFLEGEPGFELQLRLTCDLRERSKTYWWEDYIDFTTNQCEAAGERCCIECKKYVENPSAARYAARLYCNSDIIGVKDFLYRIEHEDRLVFCNDECCFLKWFSGNFPLRCESNANWNDQCLGCGSIGSENNQELCDVRFVGQRCIDYLFGDSTKCCSEECVRIALPEILRVCRELHTHDFTQEGTALSISSGEIMDNVLNSDTCAVGLLESDGWKRDDKGIWTLEDKKAAAEQP